MAPDSARSSPGTVLVLNAGSSSLKFQTFSFADGALQGRLRGQIEGIGSDARASARDAWGTVVLDEDLDDAAMRDAGAALEWLTGWMDTRLAGHEIVAVGHRVVHGGANFAAPVRVDREVLRELEALIPLAPLHQPPNLAPIRRMLDARPQLPQVACFDTAFHRTQPMEAQLFAIPRHYYDQGVRRYGFHGLSYEYIARRLEAVAPEAAAGRTVVAHLGSGVSMCALHQGRSVATTMGFSALDGCPMGTRPGSLDPGVVLYLLREGGLSLDDVETLLYRRSGLLGLSGIGSDMRELQESSDPNAKLAIDYFVYRLARELGGLAAAMGGLDALVFTAGIGENSPAIRERVCHRAEWLGIHIDHAANASGGPRISRGDSPVSVWRLPTNEERMIAEHTCATLGLLARH
jgi:acetate kinase